MWLLQICGVYSDSIVSGRASLLSDRMESSGRSVKSKGGVGTKKIAQNAYLAVSRAVMGGDEVAASRTLQEHLPLARLSAVPTFGELGPLLGLFVLCLETWTGSSLREEAKRCKLGVVVEACQTTL